MSKFDYIYSILGIIIAIAMISSPNTFIRSKKYDEDSIKTESLVKKLGIALLILSIGYGVYLFLI